MTFSFTFDMLPGRVVFGDGTRSCLRQEIAALGIKRPLFLSTKGRRAMAEQLMAESAPNGTLFSDAQVHAPAECVEAALTVARTSKADGLIACGGGSPIGIAKGMVVTQRMPILAIATTYSGSEMTPNWSITRDGLKSGGRDLNVLPQTVIYDSDLTAGLPMAASAASGLNAMAHSVEALYSEIRNPIVDLMAEEAIRTMTIALRSMKRDPQSTDARGAALYAGCLSGMVAASAGMALHHKVCHILGGTFGLPHAETHAVFLAYAARFNAAAAPGAMIRIARALDVDDAPGGIYDLARQIGIPDNLEVLGMRHTDLEHAARLTVEKPYYNPAPVTYDHVLRMLENAFSGVRP